MYILYSDSYCHSCKSVREIRFGEQLSGSKDAGCNVFCHPAVHHMLDGVHYMMDRGAIIWWTGSIIWWTRGPSYDGWGPLYDGPQIIKIQTSMNNSTTDLDIKKKISELNLKMNSLILGLLKTRVLGNLTKNGIHNMMDPIHHMLDGVHHMMAFLSIIWWTPSNIWWTGSTIWWIVEYCIYNAKYPLYRGLQN